jgi:fermentation-respiration switch protein FrsA (DUF1100 family)
MLYLNKPGAERPDIHGLAISDVRIPTPDGQVLEAWYEPPRPGKPVFLYLHGQAASLELGKWRYIRLHKEGVGYLALAYRGFSGSTGSPTEQGLFTDGLAAYDWLRARGFADRDIVIDGHSLGTGVATYVATQRPARALILEAPFTAAVDVGQERYPYMPVALLMRDRFASRDRIGDVHMPVLIVHGTADATVPFAEGQKLYGLANAPKVFIAMPGSGHNTLVCDGLYDHVWPFLGLAPADVDPGLAFTPNRHCH